MPAIDYDITGNLVVTFYDRRGDVNNILYDLYMSRIDPNGTRLQSDTRVSTFQSDPRFYTNYTGVASFVGDYQDNWSQVIGGVEYYLPSWIGIPTTTGIGDAYISGIFP